MNPNGHRHVRIRPILTWNDTRPEERAIRALRVSAYLMRGGLSRSARVAD